MDAVHRPVGELPRAALAAEAPGSAVATLAWHAGNAAGTPHRVASRRADLLGLYDLAGNVAEWVTGADGHPVTRGGSYIDEPSHVGATARARQAPFWNATDPQIPKRRWWLSDAPFVGFRLVREP